MVEQKRWQMGFLGSMLFHCFLFLMLALFVSASVSTVLPKEQIVEIDYVAGDGQAGGGGGGGGGSGQADVMPIEQIIAENTTFKQPDSIPDTNSNNDNKEEPKHSQPIDSKVNTGGAGTGSGGGNGSGFGTGTGTGSGSGSGSGTGSGIGSGRGSGIGSGTGSGTGTGKIVSPPRIIRSPMPEYPTQARKDGIQGSVQVRMVVDADGEVQDVIVSRSSGYEMLDNAAVQAVRKWRFQPAKAANGQAISCAVKRDIEFNLK